MIVWIASFPRSGNTFCRTLLHSLYDQKTYSIYNDPEIGAMGVTAQEQLPGSFEELARHERLYFVKTHLAPSDDSPAIYLLRDGRDSYVSLAHHQVIRHATPRFYDGPLLRLLGTTYYQELLEHIVRNSSWSGHVVSWTRRTAGKTFVIRFEDLIREPERQIDEALQVLGLPLPRTSNQALSFDFLHNQWPTFFRRGKVGSWRDEMPPKVHRLFWRRHGHAMRMFGYLDDAPPDLEAAKIPKSYRPIRTRWDRDFAGLPMGPEAGAAPSVSMTSLGRHGLWGNSVFQYMFLKAFARVYGLECEVPQWVGQRLFGHADRPVTYRHDVVLRDNITLLSETANHLKAVVEFVPNRAATLAEDNRTVYLLNQLKIAANREELPFRSADLEGLFMVHTHHLAPYRDYLRDLLRPGPALASQMEQLRDRLRACGKTIIGIHVRRGDFDHLYSGQGYEFVTPFSWYLRWLEHVWRRAEEPVLFVSSNNPKAVLPHFAAYNPVTSQSLGAEMPELCSDLPVKWQRNASYFPDWYLLSQCDHLAVSNSTFSFSAAMLNQGCHHFVRPSLTTRRLMPFDPWCAQPLLLLPQRATAPGEFANRIRIACDALGPEARLTGVRTAVTTYATMLRNRAQGARHFMGPLGLARELATPAFYLAARRTYGESMQ